MINKKYKKGVVYLAFGHLYLVMALFSMRTLRKQNNELPVMIITNINIDLNKFEFWDNKRDILKVLDFTDEKNREIKTNIYEHVPFEKVAYIDADTYILGNFINIWKFLDYFDLALKLNSKKQTTLGKGNQLILDSKTYVYDLPHFNGGVFFFKKTDSTKDFFNTWSMFFIKRKIEYDQVSLVDALFNSKVRILPLTSDWNYFPNWKYYFEKKNKPYILHYSNRISYSLEVELLKIARVLGFETNSLCKQINFKRLERRKKIGYVHWFKMLFCWKFFSDCEKNKWNF